MAHYLCAMCRKYSPCYLDHWFFSASFRNLFIASQTQRNTSGTVTYMRSQSPTAVATQIQKAECAIMGVKEVNSSRYCVSDELDNFAK